MLLYQSWKGSNRDITLRRVHVREFPADTMLPRYGDYSSRANTMVGRDKAPALGAIT